MNLKIKKFFLSDGDKYLNRILSSASCFIIGILAHGYFIFNQIYNSDSVYVPHGMSPILAFGRWAGVIINSFVRIYLDNSLVVISFNIILGLILLSLCAAQIIEIFNVKNKFISIVIGALLPIQPFIINSIGYSFVFHFYCFALLLTVYSTKLLLINKKIIIPSLFIGISLGIYQAYFTFFLALIFTYYFLYVIDGQDVKELFAFTWKVLFVTFASLVVFVVGNAITQNVFESSMSGHFGMGSTGLPKAGILGILLSFLKPYEYFLEIYLGKYGHVANFPIMQVCLLLIFILFIILAFKLLKKIFYNKKINFVIAIIFILLIPICINMQLLYVTGNIARMQTNIYFIYLIPLLMLDRIRVDGSELNLFSIKVSNNINFLPKFITNAILYLFIFVTLHFVFVSNGEHYRLFLLQQKYERTMQNITNLIITNKDYNDSMSIVICGNYKTPKAIMDFKNLRPFDIHDRFSDGQFSTDYSYGYAFMQMANLNVALKIPDNEKYKYKDIPNYPNPNCVQKIDDYVLLIKFSD